MNVADFYQLTPEQLLEVQQIIVKQAKSAFSYVKNTIPSYKNPEGKWESLTDKDPYALAKEFNLDIEKIPLKLACLEGLSVLADQRKFANVIHDTISNNASPVMSSGQVAKAIAANLESAGFQHNHKVSLSDKIEQTIKTHGTDAFLLMRSLSTGGRWFFTGNYIERSADPNTRQEAYDTVLGSSILNSEAKKRMVGYAGHLIDDNPVTPIYFLERFHAMCARQGLAISTHVDDSRPESLNHAARAVLSKAFLCAKQNDWDGFESALLSLEYRYVPRVTSQSHGRQALDNIKASLKNTPWQALAIPGAKKPEPTSAERQLAIEIIALQNSMDRLAKTLFGSTDDAEQKKAIQSAWNGIWKGRDSMSISDVSVEEMAECLTKSFSEFGPYMKQHYQDIVVKTRSLLLDLPDNQVTAELKSQLEELVSLDLVNVSEKLSRLNLVREWFDPDRVKTWVRDASNPEKQKHKLEEAFYQKVCTTPLAYSMGYTQRQFDDEDQQHVKMMRGIR